MKPKLIALLGGALVVILVVCVIWLNQPRGLDAILSLVEEENYQQARAALIKELEQNPDWHEARSLLVDVELGDQNPVAAMPLLIALRQANWDTLSQEGKLMEMLTLDTGTKCIEVLIAQGQSVWAMEFAVKIALLLDSPALARGTVLPLYELAPNSRQVARAWALVTKGDLVEAWRIAMQLGTKYIQELLQQIPGSETGTLLPQLISIDPTVPEFLITQAREMGGQQGLDLLLALESADWSPENHSQYPHIKFTLLQSANPQQVDAKMMAHISWEVIENKLRSLVQAEMYEEVQTAFQLLMVLADGDLIPKFEQIDPGLRLAMLQIVCPQHLNPSFFSGISAPDLYTLVEQWVSGSGWDRDEFPPATTILLLEYLAQDPLYRSRSLVLKAIVAPPPEPEPDRIYYHEVRRDQGQLRHWEASPDLRHVLYTGYDSEKTYWYDLDKQDHVAEIEAPLYGVWDSQHGMVALIPQDGGEKLYIYNTSTAAKVAEFAWSDSVVLGWQDGRLLLAAPQGSGYMVEALSPITKTRSSLTSTPLLPTLSQTGKIGYILKQAKGIQVVLNEAESTYTGSWTAQPWEMHGWLPEDRGLVLKAEAQYGILFFADGVFLPLDIEGFTPHPQGWLDQDRVVGTITVGTRAVFILDIRDRSLTHTGIDWAQNGTLAGKHAYRAQDGNMLIFRLK